MNDPKIDALSRAVKQYPDLIMSLADALKHNGFLTEEQHSELKRQRERMEATA